MASNLLTMDSVKLGTANRRSILLWPANSSSMATLAKGASLAEGGSSVDWGKTSAVEPTQFGLTCVPTRTKERAIDDKAHRRWCSERGLF